MLGNICIVTSIIIQLLEFGNTFSKPLVILYIFLVTNEQSRFFAHVCVDLMFNSLYFYAMINGVELFLFLFLFDMMNVCIDWSAASVLSV